MKLIFTPNIGFANGQIKRIIAAQIGFVPVKQDSKYMQSVSQTEFVNLKNAHTDMMIHANGQIMIQLENAMTFALITLYTMTNMTLMVLSITVLLKETVVEIHLMKKNVIKIAHF